MKKVFNLVKHSLIVGFALNIISFFPEDQKPPPIVAEQQELTVNYTIR